MGIKAEFEIQAQKWEQESEVLGIRPADRTPDHIAEKRWKQFWALWDGTEIPQLEKILDEK